MNRIIFFVLTLTILFACQNENTKDGLIDNSEFQKEIIFSELYSDSQLASQFFTINNLKDTSLITRNGMIVKVYANSFVVKDSIENWTNVEVEIKEAFKPSDFVLGNLFTQSNFQNLQSDGMVFITAKANSEELELREGSEIGFIVPTDSLDKKMMIYEGKRDSSEFVNWNFPEPILNSRLKTLERSYITITYQCEGYFDSNDSKFNEWIQKFDRQIGDELIIEDAEVKIIDIAKNFATLRETENGLFIPDLITKKGQNGFVEDFNTSYIFTVNKLGWANIDKLFDNPNSESVEMLTKIDNENDFDYVFTSLILRNEKMYLPGYQKKDNSFGFTHNDNENLILPIGSEATIMATAYKDDKPYFNFNHFVIEKNMNFSFSLYETNTEDLKRTIEENI